MCPHCREYRDQIDRVGEIARESLGKNRNRSTHQHCGRSDQEGREKDVDREMEPTSGEGKHQGNRLDPPEEHELCHPIAKDRKIAELTREAA